MSWPQTPISNSSWPVKSSSPTQFSTVVTWAPPMSKRKTVSSEKGGSGGMGRSSKRLQSGFSKEISSGGGLREKTSSKSKGGREQSSPSSSTQRWSTQCMPSGQAPQSGSGV